MKIIESHNEELLNNLILELNQILNLEPHLTICKVRSKYSDNNVYWFDISSVKDAVISEEINIFVDSIILNGMENCQIKEINNLSLEGYTTPPEE
jgi:hypothetical protein